ncbi:MAG: OmpA family protein, partial [Rhodothermales bacterium]|nr:OmpA family protein [Rhodothermales bacterium]
MADASRPGTGNAPPTDELHELRRLLLAPEQHDLADVRRRIEALEGHAIEPGDVAAVLPEAVVLRADRDEDLARALAPTLENTLRASIQRDPRPVADALYPVIGPAIRKSIREALRSMLEAVNRTIEHSVSMRSMQWRAEAWRTGRPFPEIVLAHTLQYRVEQVFLIDQETSLPLHHLAAEAVATQDEALVSGMLTAIQRFVQDSFGADRDDTLDTMRFGDLTVWVEAGPRALLAVVIRGLPQPELREAMQEVIETIHLQFKPELETFSGDPAPLEGTRPLLESTLQARYKDAPSRSPAVLWVVLALVLVPLAAWGFLRVRDGLRWDRYLAAVDAEPGLVVTQHGRDGGRWQVRGLRDPLARDPAALLAATALDPAAVEAVWEPYQALDSALVLRRAALLLQPPPTAALAFEAGRLTASGTAPAAWIEQARQRALFVPGVTAYDDGALADDARQRLDALAADVERRTLRFLTASARLAPGQEAALDALATTLDQLRAAADAAGAAMRLQVLGHASSEGDAGSNRRVSQLRAETVRRALVERGLPGAWIEAVGTGTPRLAGPERTEADREANRSVSFRLADTAPP